MDKKKLIFFEPQMTGGMGHHMDNLIESSLYFGEKRKIIWISNKKFKSSNLFIPKFVKNFKIIDDYKNNNNLEKTIKFIKDLFLNFFFLMKYIKKKKFKLLFFVLKKNFFTFPEYFHSFNNFLIKNKLNENDIIIVQSCRPRDIDLLHFVIQLNYKLPKIILRVLYPPKDKKLKNFYYFLKNIYKKKYYKNKVKIFTEVTSVKKIIENKMNIKISNFTQIYTFYKRPEINNLTVGFLGESRIDKGFDKLPELIEKLHMKNDKAKFIIQFSKKKYSNTEKYKKDIIKLKQSIKNIEICSGYLDFQIYRSFLKKITVYPILYQLGQVNNLGSGLFYSCITYEIPMIIPKNSTQLKNYLFTKNYLEASTIDEYVDGILEIDKNYIHFLNESKKLSKIYLNQIKNDPIVKEVIN